jgi:hypothetical protein
VVAQEVKALAAQTAKATDQIGTQISGRQTATQGWVTATQEIVACGTRTYEQYNNYVALVNYEKEFFMSKIPLSNTTDVRLQCAAFI